MKVGQHLRSAAAIIAIALPTIAFTAMAMPASPPVDDTKGVAPEPDYGKLPLAFEANDGQVDQAVRFLARGPRYGLFLTPTEAVLSLRAPSLGTATAGDRRAHADSPAGATQRPSGAVVRMRLAGANPQPRIAGVDRLPGNSNYFIGNDPAQWRRDVPNYAKVKYAAVYPGIDVVYYGNERQLEFDFVVAPLANPGRIALEFKGVRKLALDSDGNLVLATAAGTMVQHKPVIYQEIDGLRQAIDGRYVLRGKTRVSFHVARYDRTRPLVIDPTLMYSTYLGGGGDDFGNSMAVDGTGNAYMAGYTTGGFPDTAGAYQQTYGGGTGDAFVTKLNADGTARLYFTYLGGSGDDSASGLAVDSSGNAYVAGSTRSANFPITLGAYQTTYLGGGGRDNVFVTKLNASGNALIYSTYIGGTAGDLGQSIAVDGNGDAYVTGFTLGDYPTTVGAFQTTYGGGGDDAFVTKLNATGTALIYSTYVGGSDNDNGSAIVVDGGGNAYVAGSTRSSDFPVTPGAYQTVYGGDNRDAVVFKLNPSGDALVFSTYLGGNGKGNDRANGIAIDGSGNVYVSGDTPGGFPTTPGAYQTTFGGGPEDGFVAKLDPTGSTLLYSTYLGGSGDDYSGRLAVDGGGNAYVTGATSGPFPTTVDAHQTTYGGGPEDAFVAILNATGSALLYSTYLGTSGDDSGYGIAMDDRNVYVAGAAGGGGFPTTAGAYQTTYGGGDSDAFVVKFAALVPLNHQGLWWKFPPASEAGWGINFAHQGDIIFATWFTYDANGKPLWFAAELHMTAPGVYSGDVFTTTGPPFNAEPFDPNLVVETVVGTMTVTFINADNATLSYTISIGGQAKAAVTQTKAITRQLFAQPVPGCVWPAQVDLTLAVNYQDLWWAAPAASESGWGVNFTHQGNIIFFTWFTYGADGKPLWLIAVAELSSPGVYAGPISTVTGPAFSAQPWDPAQVVETVVGSTTITFADGNHATFTYTVNGITQTKQITRQVFVEPGTACQ